MTRRLMTLIFAVAVLASCRGRETALTGSYGDRVVSGQVVMGEGVGDSSPAGVQVSVVGTGMSTTLGADGRFAFAGVPDNAQLQFSRPDGISARIAATSGVITLTPNGARAGRSRGAKRPTPQNQYEGILQSVAADKITILDSHGQTVEIALTDSTLIRKGDKTVEATDLAQGDQVHVQATMVADVLTAFVVVVQRPEDGPGHGVEQQYEGIVKAATAELLTILDSHGQTVEIALNSSTVIRKGNLTIASGADLKEGDHVHVKAKTVDDVLTATEVILQGGGSDDDDDQTGTTMTANGEVKEVDGADLVVESQPKGLVTVQTDGKTIIKKQGQRIDVSDIKVGDEVNTMGERVDDHTLLARQIEVRGNSKH